MKYYVKIDRGLLSPVFIMGFEKAFVYMLKTGLNLKMYRDAGGVWVRIN